MRDVIRVERLPGSPGGVTDAPPSRVDTPDGLSIDGDSLAAINRVADEVLPSIVARLAVSDLGEIEVHHAGWRIRVRRGPSGSTDDAAVGSAMAQEGTTDSDPAEPPATAPSARSADIATSPAVGYFVPRPGLAVGSRTAQGDAIGWIDVLGVRQEVVAPEDGLVGKLFVDAGDPVEYGQELVQLVPGGAASGPGPEAAEV